MKQPKILNAYFKIIVLNVIAQIALRLFETASVIIKFGFLESLFGSEMIGLFYDLIVTNIALIFLFPVYFLICRISGKLADLLFSILIATLIIIHFFVLQYFLYQLIPLDIVLYQHPLKEIFFTINTADISYLKAILWLVFLLFVIYILYRFLKKRDYPEKLVLAVYLLILLTIPLLVFARFSETITLNKFSTNKLFFFGSRSISYFTKGDREVEKYTKQDAREFQELFDTKKYLSPDYPLLHEFDSTDKLGLYFNRFDAAPNIVILIVEGLSDDFIHDYKGADLMPFLSGLKNRSLYWSRCFTLGERSFAVMPSVLGGLPYGEVGFTLLDNLPRHFTLVSLLSTNNYYTSFFYGQGSWFHRKDKYFDYNNIDLVFDKKNFTEKYTKVIVNDNNYFWGYNDKDLFNQSFEVLDTIAAKRRLDIYFTGTSHAPYMISDKEYYNDRFSHIVEKLTNTDSIEYFDTYQKYMKALLFVDDAFKDFFEAYKLRPGYENTIFIITGDHPMSEMPAANSLKKYHVPLLIFSEKLKQPEIFSHTVSHLDIYETILPLLKTYHLKIPGVSTALGQNLFVTDDELEKKIALMNGNREIIDYYSNGYYISGNQIYEVDENLSLTELDDNELYQKLENELNIFKSTSLDVSVKNKILPGSIYCKSLGYTELFALENADTISFNSKYHNLTDKLEFRNQTIYYDVSFNYEGNADETISVVYVLESEKEGSILWKSMPLSDKKNSFYAHVKISKQEIGDSTFFFKSYLINPKLKKINIADLKILIYQ